MAKDTDYKNREVKDAFKATGKQFGRYMKFVIRAEVIGCGELLEIGSWTKAKELGKVRLEGKDYEFVDGDVTEFRFNV